MAKMMTVMIALLLLLGNPLMAVDAFRPISQTSTQVDAFRPISQTSTHHRLSALHAAPKRLEENVEGAVYVNDKCINCSACSHFAPSVFKRNDRDTAHIVHHQPTTADEIRDARASLAACPVAAIRVETKNLRDDEHYLSKEMALNPKFNNRPMPFPRTLVENVAYFTGHHSEKTFGATPYLVRTTENDNDVWIMVDTPKFSSQAVKTVLSIMGDKAVDGPDYHLITHVDDSAHHNDWVRQFPKMKRIFHAADLERNWVGDETLKDVEVLFQERSNAENLQAFALDGTPLSSSDDGDHSVVVLHTPGHSPGSITLYVKPTIENPGIIFTGDTYGYTTRKGGRMTAFGRYGYDLREQARILSQMHDELEWSVVAPGHGHVRDYRNVVVMDTKNNDKQDDGASLLDRTKLAELEEAQADLLAMAR